MLVGLNPFRTGQCLSTISTLDMRTSEIWS